MQLPDQGTCSVERDCPVNILSFGMGRVFMGHANVLHGPLPGFCSVTRDREGRAYVYICQDDDAHWVHMLEVCSKRCFRIRFISFLSTPMALQCCLFSQGRLKAFRFLMMPWSIYID